MKLSRAVFSMLFAASYSAAQVFAGPILYVGDTSYAETTDSRTDMLLNPQNYVAFVPPAPVQKTIHVTLKSEPVPELVKPYFKIASPTLFVVEQIRVYTDISGVPLNDEYAPRWQVFEGVPFDVVFSESPNAAPNKYIVEIMGNYVVDYTSPKKTFMNVMILEVSDGTAEVQSGPAPMNVTISMKWRKPGWNLIESDTTGTSIGEFPEPRERRFPQE